MYTEQDTEKDLARRAVASRHWKWMPGMAGIHHTLGAGRIAGIPTVEGHCVWTNGARCDLADLRIVPELDDPATLGCLLYLVREAWGNEVVHVSSDSFGCWTAAVYGHGARSFTGHSEAEVLVAALEAAP